MGSGQTPNNSAESIPASAGVIWGVKHQHTTRRKKHPEKIIKDFFILDRKCDIIEVGHIGLPTLITLYTHYLYTHTNKSGGIKINISPKELQTK